MTPLELELYEALKIAEKYVRWTHAESGTEGGRRDLEKVRAALARAEGKE